MKRGGRIRQDRGKSWVRLWAAGIARVVLLAFALQLLAPLFDLGAIAASVGESALQADLRSSLCHDASADQPQAPPSGAGHTAKHCVFCLPMAGDHAAASVAPALLLPGKSSAVTVAIAPDQVLELSRPSFARSRAPPAAPRTV